MNKEQLSLRDYILLLDKSGSMEERDCKNNSTRWEYAQETVLGIASKLSQFDSNGITVIPFAGNFKEYKDILGQEGLVKKIFAENEPLGSTDTLKVLRHVLDGYLAAHKANPETTKPITLVVVTDGVPDGGKAGQKAIADYLISVTKQMDKDEQIGVLFLQIGADPSATEFLKFLDDNLVAGGAKFDIVDTKTIEELENMTITEAMIAALED